MALTRANAEEFIELFLKRYTEQDALQFERVWLALQDSVGERTLLHMTEQIAANRTSSKPLITVAAFKAACRVHYDRSDLGKKTYKMFWEIFAEMDKKDRERMLKFMSGDSRIVPSNRYSISMHGYE